MKWMPPPTPPSFDRVGKHTWNIKRKYIYIYIVHVVLFYFKNENAHWPTCFAPLPFDDRSRSRLKWVTNTILWRHCICILNSGQIVLFYTRFTQKGLRTQQLGQFAAQNTQAVYKLFHPYMHLIAENPGLKE